MIRYNSIVKKSLWFLLLLIVLAASWSLLTLDFFRIHDYTHGARISELLRAIQDGHIPPRWTQNFGYGYGMPLYLFYAPLPYYVGAFLFWLGLPMMLVLKIIITIATVGTALAAYGIGKELTKSRLIALVMSAAITLAPYRAVNIFVRGAFSEVWGMMGGVILLYGSILYIHKKKYAPLVVVLGVVSLLLSHNLTTLIMLPLVIAWISVYAFLKANSNSIFSLFIELLKLARWYVLGFLLSAYYVIPAFIEKGATQLEETIVGGYFDYSLHFLYIRQFFWPNWKYGGSSWGPTDDISFFLGYGQLLLLAGVAVTLLLLIFQLFKRKTFSKETIIFIMTTVFVGFSLWMTLLKSKFVWDSLFLLPYIQFPWRFLSIATVFISIAGGLALYEMRRLKLFSKQSKLYRTTMFLCVVLLLLNGIFFRPEMYLNQRGNTFDDYYYQDPLRIRTNMSSILQDYIPDTLNLKMEPAKSRIKYPDDIEDVTLIVDKVHQTLVSMKPARDAEITFQTADFPGWQAYLDGQKVPHKTTGDGLIEVAVPKGDHLVGISFEDTPVRQISDGLTILGLLIVVGLGIKTKPRNKS